MSQPRPYVVLVQEDDGRWSWVLRSPNGTDIAKSVRSWQARYRARRSAGDMIRLAKRVYA